MKATTQRCRGRNHPEITISYDPEKVIAPDVEWLLRWLEHEVASGKCFRPGETVQIGWMITQVQFPVDGKSALFEPDMEAFPIKFVDSITQTLTHLRLQKSVAESVGLAEDMSFPSLRHSALVCNKLNAATDFIMDRAEPEAADSGWFIGCNDPTHSHQDAPNLERVSLYEVGRRLLPRSIIYFALPAGVSVECSNKTPRIFREQRELSIRPGSFLDLRRSAP